MTAKIEKGIPMPEKRTEKYPWREMAIGDSFFVPNPNYKHLSSVKTAAQQRTGFKFSVRSVDGGVRVWRCA